MESAIFALLGVLVGGGMLAAGTVLVWNLLQGRSDNDTVEDAEFCRKVQQQMYQAALFEAGRVHAQWLREIEQFERHNYPPQLDSTQEAQYTVVVVSSEQAAALARR